MKLFSKLSSSLIFYRQISIPIILYPGSISDLSVHLSAAHSSAVFFRLLCAWKAPCPVLSLCSRLSAPGLLISFGLCLLFAHRESNRNTPREWPAHLLAPPGSTLGQSRPTYITLYFILIAKRVGVLQPGDLWQPPNVLRRRNFALILD